ncbi:hypothetical protein LMH87_001117 [Akanthomyces muscarius]|uniref:Uncharacterized protein n=1 Tax=Akanthomyces muscarius TaxID=2231603 RepID=A0A9W8QFW5_AKAMU|nr:hypothetical protein LMH87_001117 [Akanthomyces muscarius]KAJ4155894.1 hypothetical protein LMH87_001117 [Akanthomyces muscarius]
MRFSALAFALGAAASAIPSSDLCFRDHHDDIADFADCGSRDALSQCFAQLPSGADLAALEGCYAAAGCSADDAAKEAGYALDRCTDLQREGELRRRMAAAMITPAPVLAIRENAQGDDCFSTEVSSEKICPGFVSGTSLPCTTGPVTAKSCRSGWICTEDPNGKDICMSKVDKLDIGGIVLAIVFSVIILAGISFLIFMSCAESRAQKKMNARAEATALARAATKKKRNEEVRAPLMAQQQQQPEYQAQAGGVNPFGDGQPH